MSIPEDQIEFAPDQPREWMRLSEIEKQSIRYVDKPLLQRGTFHILVARKGKGKGTSVSSFATRFTKGEYGEKRGVIWIGTEDSPSIDIRPRLEAAGGDPELVIYVMRHLTLPDDLGWLRGLVSTLADKGIDVGLIVIDPLGNHVGAINTSWDGHVRDAIQGLNPLADELDIVLVGIRHLTEKEANDLRAGVLGASAWLQVPRVAIAIVDDPIDPELKHMHAFIGNRTPPGESGRQFRIRGVLLEGLEEAVTVAEWDGESTVDIEALFASRDDSEKTPSRSEQAREYILDVIEEEGAQESDALDARVAQATGLKAKTIRNLRSDLSDKGLISPVPVKDEAGTVTTWLVKRTKAPRQAISSRSRLQIPESRSSTQESRDVDGIWTGRDPDPDSGVSQIPTEDLESGKEISSSFLLDGNGRCRRHPDAPQMWCLECRATAESTPSQQEIDARPEGWAS